jgi:hypothetical protein
VVAHHPDVAERAGPVEQVGTGRGDRAALGRGQVLGREEAERGQVGQGADRPAVVGRADRVRRVADHHRVDPLGDLAQRVVLGRVAGVVDRADRPGLLGDQRLDRGRVDVRGLVLDVGEEHRGAEHHRGRRGGHERHRRRDDLVAGLHPGGRVRGVQRGRPVGDGDRGRARHGGDVGLELGDPWAGGEPVAGQRRDHGFDVGAVDRLPPVRQHHFLSSRSLRMSSMESQRSLLSDR